MRILIPAHLGVLRGGVGTLVRGAVEALSQAITPPDELTVLTGPRGRLATRVMRGLRGPAGGIGRLLYEQSVAARMARDCDLVHLMDARPLLASAAPFILTVHDVTYLDHPEWFPPTSARYKRMMLARALAQRPAAIVCDSEYSRRRLLEHRPEVAAGEVRVIYPGVTPPVATVLPAHGGESPYFLTVAVIEPRKNHLMLLEAFRHARQQGLELDWKVVGEPGHLSEPILEALHREPGVHVLGRVPPGALETLFAGAQFTATPSLAEGFGFPPLEAMARGVATICSHGTALDETVGEAAIRLDAGDVDGWCKAILELAASDAERERLRAAGLARVETFRWERTASELIDLYHELGAARR